MIYRSSLHSRLEIPTKRWRGQSESNQIFKIGSLVPMLYTDGDLHEDGSIYGIMHP